jgi:hypothetical protein
MESKNSRDLWTNRLWYCGKLGALIGALLSVWESRSCHLGHFLGHEPPEDVCEGDRSPVELAEMGFKLLAMLPVLGVEAEQVGGHGVSDFFGFRPS